MAKAPGHTDPREPEDSVCGWVVGSSHLYFARRADIEGYPDVGGLFRDTSRPRPAAFGH
jgi:hypothetical protein